MVINNNGNVGIGTTSPADKLSVISGSVRIATSSLAGALYLGNDGSNIYLQRDNSYDLSLVQNGDSNSALYLASAGSVYVNIDSNNNDTDKAFIVQNNALKAGTELFRVSETGNVGIGTSIPSQKLHIKSNDTFAAIKFTNSVSDAGIISYSSDNLYFYTANAQRITIDTAGNVGIGTTVPGALLEISSSTAASLLNIKGAGGNGILFVSASGNVGIGTPTPGVKVDIVSSNNTSLASVLRVNSNNVAVNTSLAYDGLIASGVLTIQAGTAQSLILSANATEKMRIASDGNVGIGTSSPANKLEVQSGSILIRGDGNALFGTFYASAGENTFFTMHSGSGNTFHIGNDVSGTNYNTMVFTAATDATGGKVGIGTSSPVAKLQVNGNVSGSSFTSSISNAVGFLGTASWAQNVVSASFATTAQTANALNASNNYQVNSIGVGMAGSGTAGRIGMNEAGIRSWSITPTGGRLVIEAGDGLGSAIFACPLTSSNFVGPGTGLTGTAASLTAGTANALNASNTYTIAGLTSAYVDVNGSGTIPTTGIYRPSTKTLGLSADGTLIFKISNVSAPATSSIETGNFVVQSGNVGIGTTSPSGKLEVVGNFVINGASNSNIAQQVFTRTDVSWGIFNETDLRFYSSNSNTTSPSTLRMTIDSTGNVGIGTTSPGTKLEVSGSIRGGSFPVLVTNTGEAWFGRGGDRTLGTYTLQLGGSSATGTKFEIVDRAWTKVIASISGEAPVDSFLINTSGNLGIGTGSPVAKLQVAGNISGSSFTSSISNAVGFLGTSSFATNATSASYALSASFTSNTISSSYSLTSSFATTAQTANALNTANSYTIAGLTVNGNISASGTISASKLRVVGTANVIELSQATAGSATYYVMDNTVETGGRRYRFGYSGASADQGSFTIYNQTDNITPLTITTSGSVGIGTTTPANKLDVDGTFRATGTATLAALSITGTINSSATEAIRINNNSGYISIYNTAGTTRTGYIQGTTANALTLAAENGAVLQFNTSGSEKVRIDTNGNVGIGTTTGTFTLNVYNNADVWHARFGSATGEVRIGGQTSSGAVIQSFVPGSGTVRDLYLQRDGGNVGIGTSSPSAKLAVEGGSIATVNVTGSDVKYSFDIRTLVGGAIGFNNAAASNAYGAVTGSAYFGVAQSYPIVFTTAGTERMRLHPVGGISIGTSSQLNSSRVSIADPALKTSAGNCLTFGTATGGSNDFQLIITRGSNTDGYYALQSVEQDVGYKNIVFNQNGGNVGIGTSSPAYKLDVSGSSRFGFTSTNTHQFTGSVSVVGSVTATSFTGSLSGSITNATSASFALTSSYINPSGNAFVQGGNSFGTTATLGTNDASALVFETNGSTIMTLDTNGNVGIGTTSPSGKLDVVYGGGTANFGNTAGGNNFIWSRSSGGSISLFAGGAMGLLSTGNINFYTNQTYGSETFVTAATITTAGNVGIGSTSPVSKLDVAGTINISSGSANLRRLSFDASGIYYNWIESGGSAGTGYMAFAAGNSEAMRIITGGNVGIGTTVPAYLLDVSGSSRHGYRAADTHQFTGSVSISGSLNATASWANNALTASSLVAANSYTITNLTASNISASGTGSFGIVGIGTSSPTSKLTVVQSAGADSVLLDLQSNNDPGIRFGRPTFGSLIRHITATTDYIAFNCNGTSQPSVAATAQVVFDENGNVGIGTTSPAYKLDVKGNVFVANAANGNNTIAFGNIGTLGPLNGAPDNLTGSAFLVVSSSTASGAPSHMKFFTTTGGVCGERMRIDQSGNVGIGITSPVYKLDVNGTVNFAANVYHSIGGQKFFAGSGGTNSYIYTGTTSFAFLNSSDTSTLMTILNGGNVGIGTTLPTSKLHIVETTATGSRIQLGSISTSALMNTNLVNDFLIFTAPFSAVPATVSNNNAKWGIKMSGASTDSPNALEKSACIYAVSEEDIGAGGSGAGYNRKVGLALHTSPFDLPNVERVRINNLGNVGIGTTSPTARLHVSGSTIITGSLNVSANITCLSLTETSTEAVKYNILPLTSQLDNVLKLKPVSFNYKTNDKHSIGLIAEDVSKVYPEFTSDNNDSISYGKITSVLIQSIKELKTIIDNQQKQIENLIDKLK
jgi:hypothetical protein